MSDKHSFVSPEYPVLRTLSRGRGPDSAFPAGQAALSLGLLVGGIPSFLATIPVDEEEADDILVSLDRGAVRVAAAGISVDGNAFLEPSSEGNGWRPDPPARPLPAAFLSLICSDGRRIGVARIVSREPTAPPEEVARFVLRQIARGVQIPDLASTP
jgi:hypothetical protein